MTGKKLRTEAESTWCPGCPNHMVLESAKRAIEEKIENKKLNREEISIATGIGCHGKMFDYLNVGGVYTLHGRVLPTCLGLKIGNPNQKVIGFGGDGDTYSEGMSHFIHAARYNPDITMVVHNNQVFALTTGQATPVSEEGFKSKAQPEGTPHQPLNPLKLAIELEASFVARVHPKEMNHMKEVLKKAMEHDGYALIDTAFPCLIYNNKQEFLERNMYKLEENGHDPKNREKALEKAREWDYNTNSGKKNKDIPIGVLYKNKKKTLTEKRPKLKKLKEKNKAWWQTKK